MATSHRLELIKSIKSRKNAQPFGYGIGFASNYLEALRPCLADADCFKRMMSGVTPDQWDAACKKAATQLVFALENPFGEEQKSSIASGVKEMNSIIAQISGEAPELPKHCALVFKNIVTTNDEDRDRDILLPDGAVVDKSMPLLWQHLQPSPIGKLLGTIEQNARFLKVCSCICDVSELAHDSIKMVEAGILRISHGFKPKEFSQLPMKSGDQTPAGFLVSKYEIVEESLVSVPANSGAVIEAWATMISRKTLKSDIVKSLGERIYEKRDTANSSFGGFTAELLEQKPQEITVKVIVEQGKAADPCSCGIKNHEPAVNLSDESLNEDVEANDSPDGVKAVKSTCPLCDNDLDQTNTCTECAYVSGKHLPEAFRKALGVPETDSIRIVKMSGAVASIKDGFTNHETTGEKAILIHIVPKGVEPNYALPKEVKLWANIEGSFEWMTQVLSEQLRSFMATQAAIGNIGYNRDSPDYDYCYLEATMFDSVIACISGRAGERFYKVPYKMAEGRPVFSAEIALEEVEATAIVRPAKGTATDIMFRSVVSKDEPLTADDIKKQISVICVCDSERNLQALKEIANITKTAVDSVTSNMESKRLDSELASLLS